MNPEARLEVASNSRCQAEVYLCKNNFGRAFAHYLVALNLNPEWKPELKLKFSSTLCSWGAELESQKRYKDLFHCYEQALEIFPESEEVLNNLGAHLYRMDNKSGNMSEFFIEEWRSIMKDTLGKKCKKHQHTIRINIEAVNCGIKPAYLWDICVVSEEKMIHLLRRLKEFNFVGYNIGVISLAGDIFIVNFPKLNSLLHSVFTGSLERQFIDISHHLNFPEIVNDATKSDVFHMIDKVVKQLSLCAKNVQEMGKIELEEEWSIPCVVGVMLGYPVIYWSSNSANTCNSNILNIPLAVHKVKALANFDGVTSPQRLKELYSFSVPSSLLPRVKSNIQNWFQLELTELIQKMFTSFIIEFEINTFPIIALLGHVREASHYFRKALIIDPDFLPARRNLQTVSNLVVERWHFRMLNDRLRNEAFREALFKKVQQKFDTVLDIGTGTGLLSIFAAKAGANAVYSCDVSTTMFQIADEVLKANNFSTKVNLLNKLSLDLEIPKDIPERISLVVTETMDCGLLGEHVLTTLADAWKRLLLPPCDGFQSQKKMKSSDMKKLVTSEKQKNDEQNKESLLKNKMPNMNDHGQMWNQCFWRHSPGGSMLGHGIVIPFGAAICLAGIECHNLSRRYHLLPASVLHQHLTIPSTITCINDEENVYDTEDLHQLPGGFKYLLEPKEAVYVNFNDPEEIEARLSGSIPPEVLEVNVTSSGSLDAIAAWFILDVDEDIKLVTAPGMGSCWEQALFPLHPPLDVTAGETIQYVISNSGKRLAVTARILDDKERPENSDRPRCASSEILAIPTTSSTQSSTSCSILHLSENSLAYLNNDSWIEAAVSAAETIAQSGKKEIVLDMNPFPVFGLKMLKLGATERLVWSSHSSGAQRAEEEKVLKEIAAFNGIEDKHLACTPEESIQGAFDVIFCDLLEPNGEINETAVGKLPCLLNMLKPNGLLLPEKIVVIAQLLFSEWLAKMSHVLSDENVCNYKIAEFINIYKVPQHLDIDMNALSNDACCEPVDVFELDVKSLATDTPIKKCTLFELTIPKKCVVNAIAYWYKVELLRNLNVNSFGIKSHLKQAAILLPSELQLEADENVVIKITQHQGLLYFQINEAVSESEDAIEDFERKLNI